MGSLSKESFDAFLESLKRAGVAIYNESELRERLAEARRCFCNAGVQWTCAGHPL